MVKFLNPKEQFEIISKAPSQTKKLGKILAQEVLKTLSQKAIVIGLIGDLGGGKTTFLQGFAKGLGIKEKILSPTFVIMKKFQLTTNDKQQTTKKGKSEVGSYKLKDCFYHIDCYRIKKAKEILNLDFKKIISNPQSIIAIEWAEKIKKILPKNSIWINFKFVDKNSRKLIINI